MLRFSLFALAGAYTLQIQPMLPSATAVIALVLVAAAGLALRRNAKSSRIRPIAAFILGGAILWFAASSELRNHLDPALQGKTITITAQVIDFPSSKNDAIRLLVRPMTPAGLPPRIRLSWYEPSSEPLLGEIWRFRVRLKRPRGYSNPGGFDYEGWLHRQRIGATGYVLKQPRNLSTDGATERALRAELPTLLRLRFAQRIDSLFPAGESRAVLKAITVGARGEISDPQWQLYARTGTSHLMAISGLHIGLAAGGAFILAWAMLAPFVRHRNIRDLALLIALAVAFVYAELSGFAVPAKRAFLMALLAALAVLMRRRVSAPHILGSVCLIVYCADPLSIYAPGFILSFLAVALLLWTARSYESTDLSKPWWHASRLRGVVGAVMRIQLILLLGLMPLTIALFGRVALLAPFTNILVVPVFNLVTVPAALLGLMLDGPAAFMGDGLLKLAFASIDLALILIGMAGQWPIAAFEPSISGHQVLLISGVAVLWAVLPRGWPGRQVAFVALIATLLYKPPAPAQNCLDFHALDVGQGLAVVLRTHRRTLVYDTGPSFRHGGSTAALVVEPFLKSLGVAAIDMLVVSHSDLDHAGGVGWLQQKFDIGQMLVGEELEQGVPPGTFCQTGQAWRWDGVSFSIVHPGPEEQWLGNDASCVLLVQVGRHKLLITGDIEAIAERSILAAQRLSPVDLVVVPHHGSRTSSGSGFVTMLKPSVAVMAAGYRNRWGFPKPDIVARWETAGARVLVTGQAGAISRRYCSGQAAEPLRLEREYGRRYWHDTES